MVTCGESEHDGEGVCHEVLHDGVTENGVHMLIHGFGREEVIGVFEFGISIVDMGGDEKAVTINFCSVVGMEGMKVVCELFGDDPVQVWLVWRDESTDKLRIILKVGLSEMVRGDRCKRRVGEVLVDWSGGVIAGVLATGGGRKMWSEATHVENFSVVLLEWR